MTQSGTAATGAKRTLPQIDPEVRSSVAAKSTQIVLEAELRSRIDGEVRFDATSRMLYSTDASNYQIEPIGVVVPRSLDDVVGAIELAASHEVPILPRGGGSSLAGQTVGTALVIDFSKYVSNILDINPEERTVTAEPGLSLDRLNAALAPHELMFGPDPSSSNRATIGGVVGNNSTGAHSILYGMTSDNIVSTRFALSEGGSVTFAQVGEKRLLEQARASDPRGRLLTELLDFRTRHEGLIRSDFPPHWRRATGYSLSEFLQPLDSFNPARLLASSEGTLATILQTKLRLVPVPSHKGLVLLQFDELVAAMAATPTILETEPSAIELMDRMLIDLTRAQPGFAPRIAFIEGNPAGVLAVEYYGESERVVAQKCSALEQHLREQGVPTSVPPLQVLDPARQSDIWSVRKDALGLLSSVRGDFKPIPVIEDVSVPVEHLADFVAAIEQLVARHQTTAAYYAHASAGCLHIRPLINLKELSGVEAMSELAHAAAELAHRFGGVMSGEHGDGLQRSELNRVIFGDDLYEAMREFRGIFDPNGLMNPGKIVNAPPMTENLRYGPDYAPEEVRTHLDFSRDGGMLGAIEMCNGAAVCRKLKAGTMCPSFMATRDERDSTRGRANALRDALATPGFDTSKFTSQETYEVMDLCLSCKACKTECPSSVDMAKLKTEFLAQYYEKHGVPQRARIMGHIHTLSHFGSLFAPLANVSIRTPLGRPLMKLAGVHPKRKLAPFVRETFTERFVKSREISQSDRPTRGPVVYFHDTFTTYNYPDIGMATVTLLEAAGFEVIIEDKRGCCGRPMLSKGLVNDARSAAKTNVEVLAEYARAGTPIIGSEPSCILTMRDEYLDLLPEDDDVKAIAAHVYMFDEFLAGVARDEGLGISWKEDDPPDLLFHGHCHQKALIGMTPSMQLLEEAGYQARESGAGCCGMAGSFGYEQEHYDVSRLIGEDRLFPAVNATAQDGVVAVAGVSCKQQIEHFTERTTVHLAQALADRISPDHVWTPRVKDQFEPTTNGKDDYATVLR